MKILVFDTETTGFLKKKASLEEQCHIVQFAAVTGDILMENGEVVWYRDQTIEWKVDPGVKIPWSASQVHGIYDIDVKGKPKIEEKLPEIIELMNSVDFIVAHNLDFDEWVIKVEIDRIRIKGETIEDYMPKGKICTMKVGTPVAKIYQKGKAYYKFPKLQELFKFLFDKWFEDAHDALVDVKACGLCFIEMVRQKHITLEQVEKKQIKLF